MKEFNTTAVCIPSKHYMVDLSERVAEIKKLVDAGISSAWYQRAPAYTELLIMFSDHNPVLLSYSTPQPYMVPPRPSHKTVWL